ncbi:MAG: membrane protein insertion efficiency factor YidD [Prolixibacteraceae bacterium]|nr:membrane protein insertion efficiency factor YidD [Prolixibacteraceae bacterium]
MTMHTTINYKNIVTFSFILLFTTFFSSSLHGQESAKTSKSEHLKDLFKPGSKPDYKEYLKNSTNELEGTAALLFVGYKSIFSSQDISSCVFTPSCSVYAIETLKHDPIYIAYFKVFDRLTRCHPLSARNEYELHPKTGMLYDPVF